MFYIEVSVDYIGPKSGGIDFRNEKITRGLKLDDHFRSAAIFADIQSNDHSIPVCPSRQEQNVFSFTKPLDSSGKAPIIMTDPKRIPCDYKILKGKDILLKASYAFDEKVQTSEQIQKLAAELDRIPDFSQKEYFELAGNLFEAFRTRGGTSTGNPNFLILDASARKICNTAEIDITYMEESFFGNTRELDQAGSVRFTITPYRSKVERVLAFSPYSLIFNKYAGNDLKTLAKQVESDNHFIREQNYTVSGARTKINELFSSSDFQELSPYDRAFFLFHLLHDKDSTPPYQYFLMMDEILANQDVRDLTVYMKKTGLIFPGEAERKAAYIKYQKQLRANRHKDYSNEFTRQERAAPNKGATVKEDQLNSTASVMKSEDQDLRFNYFKNNCIPEGVTFINRINDGTSDPKFVEAHIVAAAMKDVKALNYGCFLTNTDAIQSRLSLPEKAFHFCPVFRKQDNEVVFMPLGFAPDNNCISTGSCKMMSIGLIPLQEQDARELIKKYRLDCGVLVQPTDAPPSISTEIIPEQ